MSESSSVYSRLFGAFGATLYSALATFASQIIAARLLGAEEFGAYAYGLSCLTLLSVLLSMGFPSAILRFVPHHSALGDWPKGVAVLKFTERMLIPIAIACVIASAAVWFFGSTRGTISLMVLAVAFVSVPFAALVKVQASALRTIGKTTLAVLVETPVRETLVALAFLALTLLALSVTAIAAMCVVLAASAAAAFFAHRLCRARLPRVLPSDLSVAERRQVITASLGMLAVTAGYLALRRVDVILVGNIVGVREAGLYSVASRLADVLQLPLNAAMVITAPRVSRAFAKGDTDALRQAVRESAMFPVALCVAGAVPLLLLPGFFLGFFGPDFTEAAALVRLLVIGQIIGTAAGTVNLLLTMTGHERTVLRVVCVLGCLHLLMCATFLGFWGVVGGAAASLISGLAFNIVLGTIVYRKLGVSPGVFCFLQRKLQSRVEVREG